MDRIHSGKEWRVSPSIINHATSGRTVSKRINLFPTINCE